MKTYYDGLNDAYKAVASRAIYYAKQRHIPSEKNRWEQRYFAAYFAAREIKHMRDTCCSHCGRDAREVVTCGFGGCPCGGDL